MYGVIVVPMMATTNCVPPNERGSVGTTSPCATLAPVRMRERSRRRDRRRTRGPSRGTRARRSCRNRRPRASREVTPATGTAMRRGTLKQLGGGADPDELRERGAEVGDEQRHDDERRHPHAEVLAHEVREAHAGHGAEPRAHLLHDDQCDEDDDDHPQQLVAVAGAGGGVRGDAAGVVAGVGCDQSGAEDRRGGGRGGETGARAHATAKRRAGRGSACSNPCCARSFGMTIAHHFRVSRQTRGCAPVSTTPSTRRRARRRRSWRRGSAAPRRRRG